MLRETGEQMAFVAAVDGLDFMTFRVDKMLLPHVIILHVCSFEEIKSYKLHHCRNVLAADCTCRFHFIHGFFYGTKCVRGLTHHRGGGGRGGEEKKIINARARRMKITHLHFLLALEWE